MSYTRHISAQDGNAGFRNGDTLTAEDMNKVELALVESDTRWTANDATMSTVLSDIVVLTKAQIDSMCEQASVDAGEQEEQENTQQEEEENTQ